MFVLFFWFLGAYALAGSLGTLGWPSTAGSICWALLGAVAVLLATADQHHGRKLAWRLAAAGLSFGATVLVLVSLFRLPFWPAAPVSYAVVFAGYLGCIFLQPVSADGRRLPPRSKRVDLCQ